MLAQVIAHEIEHLLLGPNSHSSSGIMLGEWRLQDLGSISRGGIGFTPQQCERIQMEVKRRQFQYNLSGFETAQRGFSVAQGEEKERDRGEKMSADRTAHGD
jgi:hypothetical protein